MNIRAGRKIMSKTVLSYSIPRAEETYRLDHVIANVKGFIPDRFFVGHFSTDNGPKCSSSLGISKLNIGCKSQSNTGVDLTNFRVDDEGYVVVYTDGACRSNGRRGAKAGIGVWFGDNHAMNISEPVQGNRQTNNTAEIQAAKEAVLKAKEAGINKLNVKTDSKFVINCITKWISSWRKNGWKLSGGKPVKNREDLERLCEATSDVRIKWSYVPGHKGHYGNKQADLLAVSGTEK